MLDNMFIFVLNMSLISSYVTLFVLIARIFLKKTPKIFSYALWGVVLFRLVCPFSFESMLSFMPTGNAPIPQDIIYSMTPQINTGIAAFDSVINPILPMPINIGASVNSMQILIFIGAVVWILGMIAMIIYSVVVFIKLKRRLLSVAHYKESIYLADHIPSPFVMGLFKPKIYLPSSITDNEKDFIIAHEMCHVRRLDHVTRILGFAALTIHWFNPLVWIAFIISARDMEMSCDEAVMKKMNTDIRAEYSQSLLRFRAVKRMLHATPLAFGEGDTKMRIKNVLSYKKPAFWVVILATVAIILVGLSLISNPKSNNHTLQPDISSTQQLKYYIMTDEVVSIGGEYGVSKNNELDTLQMLAELTKLQGFIFDSDWAEHGYVKLSFQDAIKPKSVFLRYCANVDDIWQQEYPIDSADYKIKVPAKEGIYSFFADITWENGERETAYFSITVETRKSDVAPISLTKETATEFINQTLSSFTLGADNTVSFTLPEVIPTEKSGKTKLYISSSATFSKEPSTSSIQEILDWNTDWQGGESHTQKLDMSRGKLTRLFLRVAFTTSEDENSYREYAADYIELIEPFAYDSPANITNRSVEINEVGSSSLLKYTMQNGESFSVMLDLPKGLTLSLSESYPEYASSPSYEMPTLVVVKNDNPIGSLALSGFGTYDKNDLKGFNVDENALPMQIFAPIALSNHAQFDNYKVCKSSLTGANATAEYSWQDLTDYGGRAPQAPWLKADSVLAYDYENAPFFFYFNLTAGSLTAAELENLAKSIIITS